MDGVKDDSRGRNERAVPPCPRCGTALNVRRSRRFEAGTWTCRYCRFKFWARQVAHDRERVIAEAEEIRRGRGVTVERPETLPPQNLAAEEFVVGGRHA